MSRVILCYGQPASGKTYSLRNLDPKTTVIFDGDQKNALAWRGWKRQYSKENKNFFPVAFKSWGWFVSCVQKIGAENSESKHIKTVVVDGFNSLLTESDILSDDTSFNKWKGIARDFYSFVRMVQALRDDLTVVINAHVETADPNTPSAIDRVRTPGKQLEKISLESLLAYVFYAKSVDGEYFFETRGLKSSARSPEGCFEVKIPNDMAAAISIIEKYEEEEAGAIDS